MSGAERLGGWTPERLRTAIRTAVVEEGTPGFYAVVGSRMYGFADGDSDVDVRGFHRAPASDFLRLSEPTERVAVDPPIGAGSRRDRADLDLVSYELRKFGRLLYAGNFNALEAVFGGIVVADPNPERTDELRRIVREELPLDVPRRYAGMAEQNRREIGRALAADDPRSAAKRCLYALRGMLAARYVEERSEIAADVRTLSNAVLGDGALVEELIAAKRDAGTDALDPSLVDRTQRTLEALSEPGLEDRVADKETYRRRLDGWMLGVRGVEDG